MRTELDASIGSSSRRTVASGLLACALPFLGLSACAQDWAAPGAADDGGRPDSDGVAEDDSGRDGTTEDDGTAPDVDVALDDADGAGDVRPPDCGDGSVQDGEECDDGNDLAGDGCDPDCSFSCHPDTEDECPDDGNRCTVESCVVAAAGRGFVCVRADLSGPCDDGDPCTLGDVCDGGECRAGESLTPAYRDVDGDGYGDPSTRTCDDHVPEGYVGNGDDCCDALPDVHPLQTAFFADSHACGDVGAPNWDYDCDGGATPQWTDCVACLSPGPGGECRATPGWSAVWGPGGECAPPACGAAGSWILSCSRDADGACVPGPVFEARRQTCR